MLRGFLPILMFTLPCLVFAESEEPFWRRKEKLYERVKGGEVIVSVTAHDVSPQRPKWDLIVGGGGHVNAPCALVFTEGQKYEKLAGLAGYVTKAKYDAGNEKLHITISAYGYTRDVTLAVKAADGREIELRMLDGPMAGFWWKLTMSEFKPAVCEVAITGDYKYDEFPIPRIFLQFGMEVVMKRSAERLRRHVHAVHSKTPGQGAIHMKESSRISGP